jgi:exosortase/archaeosortase family protein
VAKSPFVNKAVSFLIFFIIISFYNSVRISLHAIYPQTATVHNWFFNLVLIPRWLLVVGFAWYYWKKFPTPIEWLKKRFGFEQTYIRNTFVKIALLVLVYYIVIILTFNNLIFLNGDLLISFILKTSKYFIELLGYQCWIDNRLIYSTKVSLYMDDACIGINLMFLFAAFISLLPGALKHKLWYIPSGLIIIILLNCLRVVFIFINMSRSGSYTLFMDVHDLYTYPVLVFTFLMWMIWINKFFKTHAKKSQKTDNVLI